jgi:hypothetical protein
MTMPLVLLNSCASSSRLESQAGISGGSEGTVNVQGLGIFVLRS